MEQRLRGGGSITGSPRVIKESVIKVKDVKVLKGPVLNLQVLFLTLTEEIHLTLIRPILVTVCGH